MDQRRADILRDILLDRPLDQWIPDPYDPDNPYDDDPAHPYAGDPVEQPAPGTDPPAEPADTTELVTEPEPPAQTKEPAAQTAQPRQPLLDLTASRETLDGTSEEPGELAGYGPVTAATARRIATSGSANVHLLDQMQRRIEEMRGKMWAGHDPPADLAAAVRARDATCRFPGCRQPAQRCDLDHTIPHPDGPTTRTNLGCLCRRHHQLKTWGIWHATQLADATYIWTSPTGLVLRTYPRGPTS